MSAVLMDGKAASEEVVGALQVRVGELPFTPRLTFVRVGDDPASAYYVRSKERMARRVGVASETRVLPEGTSQAELLAIVAELNSDPEVDGLLVQLPAPGVDEATVLAAIDPDKDVDGLHPLNGGRLWTGRPGLRPATPSGVIALADRYGVELEGARAVVVGRSNLVGKPLAAMLLERNATVTLAHSRTRDLAAVCRDADVLVAVTDMVLLSDEPVFHQYRFWAVGTLQGRGLDVAAISELRRALREAGGEYKVYKNTLVRFAAREVGLDLDELLTGPTAIAFVPETDDGRPGDPVTVAKALRDFARNHPALVVKGGVMDNALLSAEEARALADVEPREVLLAKLAGALAAPMQQFAGLLQALPRNFAYGLSALIDKGGASPDGATPTDTNDAPAADAAEPTTEES